MSEQVDKATGEIQFKPKGKGSFWISKKAIEVLLDNKATAMQIAAYLVMAKHTEESGKLATSGIKAIHKATGVNHTIGERAMLALMQMKVGTGTANRLVYKPEEWSKLTKEEIIEAPFERAEVRYVLNDFKSKAEDKVWFSNELITGTGKFTQPLKKLKMCGDSAARLLLIGYRENNLEQYGGVKPIAFYKQYEMSKIRNDIEGFDLWHGKAGSDSSSLDWMRAAGVQQALNQLKKGEEYDRLFSEGSSEFLRAVKSLDAAGFIYEMVSVLDREEKNDEAQVIYELDAKSKHGYKPKGEEGVAGITARLSAAIGNPVADSMGRFYGKYAAIVPAGIQPHIIGIYRLRFRVSNTKNHGVTGAWARIHQCQREAADWLADFAERNGIEMSGNGETKSVEPF